MTVKELKKGEYFTLKNIEFPSDSQVWIRGAYDRETRRYSIINFADINRERLIKGTTPVFTEMTF